LFPARILSGYYWVETRKATYPSVMAAAYQPQVTTGFSLRERGASMAVPRYFRPEKRWSSIYRVNRPWQGNIAAHNDLNVIKLC